MIMSIKRNLILVLILLHFSAGNSAQKLIIPKHGVSENTPAEKWEDSFVSGNGRMGAMYYGKPGDETLVANHCRLYLPMGSKEIVPHLDGKMNEAKKVYMEKNPGQAINYLLGEAKQQGFPGIIFTDPYHPGFFVNIKQETVGVIKDYHRTENFQTGEVITSFQDGKGHFIRKMFVSRADNIIVLSLSGPGICELGFSLSEKDNTSEKENTIQDYVQKYIHAQISTSKDWVSIHNVYTKGKGGYDAGIRIMKRGGSTEVIGNTIKIRGAKEILLSMQIVPWKTPLPEQESEAWAYSPNNPDFTKIGNYQSNLSTSENSRLSYRSVNESVELAGQIKKALMDKDANYKKLFASHVPLHQELFNQVVFDLDSGKDKTRTASSLLTEAAKTGEAPLTLMEKMYDAGRYMYICSAGETLPNLQGIWTASWSPRWSGDYTLDANVAAAMASACSSDLEDLQEGFFRTMENFYPEWKLNASRIYGCRGFLTNVRASNTALLLHWGTWPGIFWTAGCGWMASFFSRYVDYTQNMNFLQKRCIPLLKEIALFYEDFLTEDKNGQYEFIPSYNPETLYAPNNHQKITATMDIAVAKEVLNDLIRFSKISGSTDNETSKWRSMLEKLPSYPVHDGILTEWQDGGLDIHHRHFSQLYPCFQSFDPLFESDSVLHAAAQKSVLLKVEGTNDIGQQSSFGRIQSGISLAYLGMGNEAYGRLNALAVGRSMNAGLITSHDPNAHIFNVDGNGGVPQIIATMLAFSRVNSVDILRALPSAWPNGSIKGLNLACGAKVDIIWKNGKLCTAIFHAKRDTKFTISYKSNKQLISMKKGDILRWK